MGGLAVSEDEIKVNISMVIKIFSVLISIILVMKLVETITLV